MGVVYRAQDLKLQRPVAIKLLAPELVQDAERRKRFFQEARAAARITHPAIAQIYDVDEVDGVIFIAMELVEGATVRDLIRRRELDLLGSIDVAIQVAEGLARAHEAGIVHRDIKPANVMLTKDGHAKILDFGLAKLADPAEPAGGEGMSMLSTVTQTRVGTLMGTAAYMSPEQVKGLPVDFRSDLFSLGVTLFEMATWELPFQRNTMMETLHAVAFDETPSIHSVRPNLPLELQQIISRCLRKRPEDRYPDARTLVQELRALRRDTESGKASTFSLRRRVLEVMRQLPQLAPRQYGWAAGVLVGLALILYLILTNVSLGGFIGFSIVALLAYRHVRNRPQRMVEQFVRKIRHVPEVRLISVQDRRITVIVDRPVGQLYGRINAQLNACNRKLFFGDPMSVTIRHDLAAPETHTLLTSTGVHYVRDDVATAVARTGGTAQER
jgi:eukaryotic-like serine/threonine-protein kinase